MTSDRVVIASRYWPTALSLIRSLGAAGFVVDLVYRNNPKKPGIHELCENEHCSCEDGIVKAAIKHTLNIFIFILITKSFIWILNSKIF